MNKKQQFLSFFLICCSVFPLAGSCVHQFRIQSFSRETILIAKISSFFSCILVYFTIVVYLSFMS